MRAPSDVHREPAPGPKSVRLLNKRLLVTSVIVVVLGAVSLAGWHRFQVRRTAGSLLERAAYLESQGDWAKAAKYIQRYLRLRPDDRDARVRLAHTFDKSVVHGGKNPRAIELYYQAVAAATGSRQIECRERLAELLLASQRFEETLDQSAIVLEESPDGLVAMRLRALALYQGHRHGAFAGKKLEPAEIFDALLAARQLDAGRVELSTALAYVYREIPELLPPALSLDREQREKAANRTMDELVEAAADDARAVVCRHLYRDRYGLEGAEEDIQRAVALTPDDVAVRILAGRFWTDKAQQDNSGQPLSETASSALDRATVHFQHIIDHIDATSEAAYIGLGEVFALQNESQSAIRTWESGLKALRGNSWALNVRLAEAYTDVGDIENAVQSVAAARDISSQLDKRSQTFTASYDRLLDLLQAQLKVRQGELGEAARQLRHVTAAGGLSPSEAARAQRGWMALGQAQGQRGSWDRAAAAFEKSTQLRPTLPSPHLGAAVAWHKAHRLDLAIPHYRELLSLADSAELWLALAQARFEKTLLAPEHERQWQGVQAALSQAKARTEDDNEQLSETWRLGVLEAQLIAVGGDEPSQSEGDRIGRVMRILASLESEYPDVPELYARLSLIYERLGQQAAADQAAESLKRITEGDARWRTAQARLEAFRGGYAAAKSLIQDANGDENAEMLLVLVGVCASDGDVDGVRGALEALYRLEPWSLKIPVQLAELAIHQADFEEAARWQNELDRRGEEGHGHALYCAALALVSQATGGVDPRVEQARGLYRKIERLRPFWPATYSLKGQLHELEGSMPLAIDAYKQAVDLGEQRTWVLQRLVVLLNRLRRFEEADTFLAKLQTTGPLLSALEIPLFAADEKGAVQFVEAARKAVRRNPQDARARTWYGHLLLQKARSSGTHSEPALVEARQQFEKATSLAPQDSEAWNGLFTYYLFREQIAEARRTLFELVNRCDLQGAQRAYVLAQGYELMGDLQAAFEQYELALGQTAVRSPISLCMARLASQSDPQQAERILRHLLKEDGDLIEARHALASLLAASDGQRKFEEAMSLLDDVDGKPRSAGTLRLKANLLLRRQREPASARQEAREILERLLSLHEVAVSADSLLLAQVCERQFDFDVARNYYLAAASSAQATPRMLESCAEFLLRQDDLDEADRWLRLLEGRVNEGPRTLRLRAQWLQARSRASEIGPRVEAYANGQIQTLNDPQQRIQFCQTIGRIYESAESPELAENWYRQLQQLDSKQYGRLALCLALQRPAKTDEAVRLCLDAAREDKTPTPAITLAGVLVAANTPRAEDPRVRAVLTDALHSHPDNAGLLNALANLDVIRGQTEAAIQKFKGVLLQQPDDPLVLNNLVILMAGEPSWRAEAEEYLQRARRIAGEGPELLDTHAVLLLWQGKPREAIDRLQEALRLGYDTQVVRFHLAAAFDAAGMPEAARESFAALDLEKLPAQILSPADKTLFAELLNRFEPGRGNTGAGAL